MMRFLLSEDLDAIPGVILIIRSSSEPPHEWKAGFESLEEGLPVFGHMVLQQFRQMSGIRTPAVLHASWNMKTRELPATEALEDRFGDTEPHRNQKNNAFKWTNAITKDLKCATDPIIITGGWDGWTCNTQRLPAWLKRTPNARWFIRLTNLRYDEDECLLRKHGNLYWAEFDSVSIDQALRTTTGRNPAQNQLVRVWDQIQTSKDHRGGAGALFNGRNNLAIDLEDIEISTDG
ncbi:hypothetical protein HBI95_178830 [Parastagonospora nodorum]|nr:hypothetical protein HBI95_178830 [Parastagonospora nodorum]KAH4201485.1 hypothetical protein HBH42_030090 [Parastagonospora nodorum]KAH4897841.1 hypothetical protein HBH74_189440 [Parastagonospora nodorum]KAH4982825.1 hypothetical protein HBH73_032970 [Parastagonospora nodorum]KAH5513773.1 hypothetical protein HBI31_014600 [Parastagonospora nodorum]